MWDWFRQPSIDAGTTGTMPTIWCPNLLVKKNTAWKLLKNASHVLYEINDYN